MEVLEIIIEGMESLDSFKWKILNETTGGDHEENLRYQPLFKKIRPQRHDTTTYFAKKKFAKNLCIFLSWFINRKLNQKIIYKLDSIRIN